MKYGLTQKQVSSLLGNEIVILNHQDGVYYSMEDVGTLVWEKLNEQPHTFDELVAHICQVYEIDEATCRTDLAGLMASLVKEKLVSELLTDQ